MNIFNKEKELIFKITNAIFLLWLVAAVTIFIASGIKLIVEEPKLTYEEYEIVNCRWFKEDQELTDDEAESRCRSNYEAENVYRKNDDYSQKISLYTAGANVIVVGTALVLMNRKK